jgi:hypothetical protein
VVAVGDTPKFVVVQRKDAEPRYEGGPSKDQLHGGFPRLMSVTYTATLPVREQTVLYLSSLLRAERVRRGARTGSRALSTFTQAVLVLRWFLGRHPR